MRVLHVITGLGVGGAELQLRALLQHTRHDAEVVTLYNAGPVADMIRADGISVRDLGMTSNTQLSAVFALRRMIRAGRFDVVHAHLYRSQVYGRLAAWLAGTPVVVSTEHSIGDTHLERRRMTRGVQALYLATGLVSQATIAVSETVRERLANWGVPARKLVLIPNGVDFSRVAFDPAALRGRCRFRGPEFASPTSAGPPGPARFRAIRPFRAFAAVLPAPFRRTSPMPPGWLAERRRDLVPVAPHRRACFRAEAFFPMFFSMRVRVDESRRRSPTRLRECADAGAGVRPLKIFRRSC